jgi:Protein of unknown function (DUF4242)
MVYVVERYLPGLSRTDLLPRLSRLEPVIEELRDEGSAVRYLGSAIVLEDEACFCQFEASSVAVVSEVNPRADLPFDRIVPAVLVQPTQRSGEMSMSTSIPRTAEPRRPHRLASIAGIAAVLALAAWAVATYAVDAGTRSARSNTPIETSALRHLTPAEREYVLGITSMTPVQMRAAFGTSLTSVQGLGTPSGAQAARSSTPHLAAVPRSLSASERRYVFGIESLTPLRLWAAFGTSATPPVSHGRGDGTTGSSETASSSVALSILPGCAPGPCWHAVGNRPRRAVHDR